MPSALIIDGHPDAESLTASIAQRYADGYGDARLLALRDLDFDPHMRFGYRERMPLEPDLADAKQAMQEAKTIIIATPLWWGSVPALLKGFFDRALLPQQEYRYASNGLPEGLLKGRRGRMFLLADTPWAAAPILGLPAATHVARSTMKFCGVRPFRVHRLLGVKGSDDVKIARWLDEAERIGKSDAQRDADRPTPQAIAAEAASSSVVATS
ncbi:NAD(P)H-dependent oxidoreductase [Microbacterium sp. AK031]|uniref:NAD(P)H-dependent oxidoreductase n=1 Tax=Microbacterium sp. AK031 TaxID=2723076 RepID=UPI00216A5C0E|nr:NAD(P)H-dependent oxidoreductase [Microbacterium sp. AK031]MCS3843157.1 putative NADPH-quinone reductase [Microbacterium sp. AK031]